MSEMRIWCSPHDAEGVENHGGSSDECWRVVWADTDAPEGTGHPYELCRMVNRLALLQECDQCPGDGVEYVTFKEPCPSCSGRGSVVSDQAVEKGAEAMYEADDTYRDTWESQPEPGVKDWYRNMARAVLAAAIFGEEKE